MRKVKTKQTHKGYLRKELKFFYEGKNYTVVIQCTARKLKEAADNATFGCGAKLSSAELFDITTFHENHK